MLFSLTSVLPKIISGHNMSFENITRDKRWSLFLDRDGVINKKVDNGYVLSIQDMEFIPGSLKAIGLLSNIFENIFIVTNQQCVGKGLLSSNELDSIHRFMLDRIRENGGHIKDIFVSPHLEKEKNRFRKPGTGMAEDAVRKYPVTDLKRSVMAGDTVTDMLFGRNAGMVNVLIGDAVINDRSLYDFKFKSLLLFADAFRGK